MSFPRPVLRWAALAALVGTAGCGPGRAPEQRLARAQSHPVPRADRERPPFALDVRVFADTSRAVPLDPSRPPARVWLERVAPTRPAPLAPALPAAEPDTVPAEVRAGPALEVESGLQPPVLRSAAVLRLPRSPRRAVAVDLDLRVDETGAVTDAIPAGGDADSALVAAAIDCAVGMTFFPARLEGRPIAVWCRQRFDFDRR